MKTAIVTGAARGIGRAIVERLAPNYHVLATDVLAGQLSGFPSSVTTLSADISSEPVPEQLVSTIMERYGRLDLLVNNAGTTVSKPLHETSDEEFDRVLNINTRSVFRLCRAAIGVMQSGAAVVNIASVFGIRGNPNSAAYAASKAAVAGLTRQMAADYAPQGIRVNAIAPGLIITDMTRERVESNPRFQDLMVKTTPSPRLGQPDDIAAAVNFLASDDAQFIYGHVLVVDGGWSIANYRPES